MKNLSLFTILYILLPQATVYSAERSPNIVFIMADDLGYGDLGCYGQKLIATPRIDRLAAAGIRFTQAYAGGPVCASSRSVLMTGMHTGHTPARDNVPHYHTYLEEDDVTVAEILGDAGYRCGGVGKWSLGDAGTVGRATNQGFHSWFGYLNQDHAHYYDLSRDIGEANDIASTHPEIVKRIRDIMDQAVAPSPRYEIGTVYRGGPIWKKSQ